MPHVSCLIVAAGRGERLGGEIPKQYLEIGGKSLLVRAIEAFAAHPMVQAVTVVIGEADSPRYQDAIGRASHDKLRPPVIGGATRQDSVRKGLESLDEPADAIVLIHDAARPFVSESLITRAIAAAEQHGAAIPVLPLADTVKQVDAAGQVLATPDRSTLRAVQTPQAFRLSLIRDNHRAAVASSATGFTDDASICEWAGQAVATFAGDFDAFKVTTADDFRRADWLANGSAALRDIRVATGYDVHAFGPGDHVWLGGVKINHDQALIGHSDADPVLHAITDALLGAIGDGDIGVHFPPSDPQWRGAASHLFLTDAARRVRERRGRIVHLDATVVCEAPKIGPHRDAMRAAIAKAADVSIDQVGLKATTSERLGFTGRREGIAALATATVELPR